MLERYKFLGQQMRVAHSGGRDVRTVKTTGLSDGLYQFRLTGDSDSTASLSKRSGACDYRLS